MNKIVTWWRHDPKARLIVRTFVVGVVAYVTSALSSGDAFGRGMNFVWGAVGAGAYAVIGALTPVEPLVGVKAHVVERRAR